MYDMHFDLLTILYMIDNNKYKDKEKIIEYLKNIYKVNNIKGGIINLYFMTKKEMKNELSISLKELKNINNMFSKSINYLEKLKDKNIISNAKFIYSIEGIDYIKNNKHLEELYNMGLRSIILTWNHKNKYGSGYRTKNGLTKKGKKIIKKAIELGIIIDVSHANKKTFNDILDAYEKYKKDDSILIASHINVKSICNKKRNLSDEELNRLKNIGGYIGLFTNSKFLTNDYLKLSKIEKQKYFIKHLNYIINDIGFDYHKIIISTDDMDFHPLNKYHNRNCFNMENINKEITNLITKNFNKKIANLILRENPKDIIDKVAFL